MYSKEEASKLREQFWINFGKYMKPVPSVNGTSINWVNYKTGVKNVSFKMNAEQYQASIAIEITHKDPAIRKLYFEQFVAFRLLLTDALEEKWDWQEEAINNYGQAISQINKVLPNVNIYQQEDWPALISFFKPRIIALDEFWTDVKPIFEAL